ncbi:hypothetical protein MKX03_036038 [Papaver bracteatum]|nr:hypothetical protein MKX03_036038 [Papaver bracteatum]
METSRRIAYGITQSIYLILLLFFTVLSTTSVVYTVACFYTSKEITYKKVTGVLRRLWGRLISTFFWGLVMVAIYTSVALIFFSSSFSNREDILAFIIPYFPVLIYVIVIWNVATVVTVLEKDYGVKALAKSWRIIYGKRWVSCTAFGLLQIVFTGIIFTFCYLFGRVCNCTPLLYTSSAPDPVVYGNKMNLVGKVFLGIVCYLLTTIWIHFSLVLNTVVYFVCKSYHNEDISNIANHAEVVPIIPLVGENEVQLERIPV